MAESDYHTNIHNLDQPIQNFEPNYYAVIPAHVRYCKDLEPCARLLYGEITALANKHGYCYASNEYFANLYDVDVRTVKYWVESLQKHGFIHIQTEKKGMYWDRKIFISQEIKEMFAKGNNFPYRGEKNAPIEGKKISPKQVHNKNTTLVNENKYSLPLNESPDVHVFMSNFKQISSTCSDLTRKYRLTDGETEIYHWLESKNLGARPQDLSWWAKTVDKQRLQDVITYAIKMKPQNLGKYINRLLKQQAKVDTTNSEKNRIWLQQAKKDLGINVKINKQYAILENGTEIDLHMPHDDFTRHLTDKLQLFGS